MDIQLKPDRAVLVLCSVRLGPYAAYTPSISQEKGPGGEAVAWLVVVRMGMKRLLLRLHPAGPATYWKFASKSYKISSQIKTNFTIQNEK